MRKNLLLAVLLILGVIFMTLPALADYNETTTWNNQLDNTKNAPNFGAIGAAADDNKQFGTGTIKVPEAGDSGIPGYFGGCPTNVVNLSGNPISTSYNCADMTENAIEPTVNLQDLFMSVVEGNTDKTSSTRPLQGISQYLDQLFSMPGDNGSPIANQLYIDQTLDQDLADISVKVGGQYYGIWQRLHTAVDVFGTGNNNDGLGPWLTQARGIDQTVEAYMSDYHPSSGPGDLGNAVTVYMGQWFQGGTNLKCGVGSISADLCTHNEFGGHGTVTSTKATPNTAQHDP